MAGFYFFYVFEIGFSYNYGIKWEGTFKQRTIKTTNPRFNITGELACQIYLSVFNVERETPLNVFYLLVGG